jgi:hypothetical protein
MREARCKTTKHTQRTEVHPPSMKSPPCTLPSLASAFTSSFGGERGRCTSRVLSSLSPLSIHHL